MGLSDGKLGTRGVGKTGDLGEVVRHCICGCGKGGLEGEDRGLEWIGQATTGFGRGGNGRMDERSCAGRIVPDLPSRD